MVDHNHRQIGRDEFRNTMASRLQDEDCCHICGEQFEHGDKWQYVDAIERYNEDQGKTNQQFKTHWHYGCHYDRVTLKGMH